MSKEVEIKKLEKKLSQIRNGKWVEDADHVKKLESRLDSLRKEQANENISNGRYA